MLTGVARTIGSFGGALLSENGFDISPTGRGFFVSADGIWAINVKSRLIEYLGDMPYPVVNGASVELDVPAGPEGWSLR